MQGKLLLIVVASGLTAAALLVLRHRRIEIAHEMSAVHGRILTSERSLWDLRSRIAERSRPEEIRGLMDGLPQGWTSVPDPWADAPGVPAAPEPPATEAADPAEPPAAADTTSAPDLAGRTPAAPDEGVDQGG